MNRYKQIAREVEESFLEPQYQPQRITYIEDRESADICISARHTMGDYLLVGIIALQHSINGKSGDILVFNDINPEFDIIGCAASWDASFRQVAVNTTIYFQTHEIIEEIYQKLYKGKLIVSGIGLNISVALMIEFSKLGCGIPKEIMSGVIFENFDDLKTAQENAFHLIKKMTGSAVAGTMYAFENGED